MCLWIGPPGLSPVFWASTYQDGEEACGIKIREKKWSGSCTVVRTRTEDPKVLKNRLIWVAHTVPWGQGMSVYCSRGSGSVTQQQLGSVSMSVVLVTMKSSQVVSCLGCHLRSCYCPTTMLLLGALLIWVAWDASWGHGKTRPKLRPNAMYGSMVLP